MVVDEKRSSQEDNLRERRRKNERDEKRKNERANGSCQRDKLKSARRQTLVKKVERIVNTPVRRSIVIVSIVAQTGSRENLRDIGYLCTRRNEIRPAGAQFRKPARRDPEKLKFLGREKCWNIRPGVRVSCHSRDCTSVSHQERNAPFSQRPFDISRTTEGFINFRR